MVTVKSLIGTVSNFFIMTGGNSSHEDTTKSHMFILVKTINTGSGEFYQLLRSLKSNELCKSIFTIYGSWDYLIELEGDKEAVHLLLKRIVNHGDVVSTQLLQSISKVI